MKNIHRTLYFALAVALTLAPGSAVAAKKGERAQTRSDDEARRPKKKTKPQPRAVRGERREERASPRTPRRKSAAPAERERRRPPPPAARRERRRSSPPAAQRRDRRRPPPSASPRRPRSDSPSHARRSAPPPRRVSSRRPGRRHDVHPVYRFGRGHGHRHRHPPRVFIRWRHWPARHTYVYLEPSPVTTQTIIVGAPSIDAAWRALADGQAGTAHQLFDGAVRRDPSDAEAYVGLGLALATLGDYTEAAGAMRHAVELDVVLVASIGLEPTYEARVADLAAACAENAAQDVWNTDYPFLLATLRLLLGDVDAAQESVAAATVRGERSAALDTLRRQLDVLDRE